MQKIVLLTLVVILILAVVLVWFVRSADVPSSADQVAAYEAALARTEDQGPAPGADTEAAIDRVRRFFADLTPETVRSMAGEVYASDAYFNDTLKTIRGGEAIEAYFLKTAQNAASVRVQFVNIARDGDDFYFRWRMTMRVDALEGGEPLISWGVTHFRFDEAGRVTIHQDFWDSAGGLYEYIPVIGGLLRAIRARL